MQSVIWAARHPLSNCTELALQQRDSKQRRWLKHESIAEPAKGVVCCRQRWSRLLGCLITRETLRLCFMFSSVAPIRVYKDAEQSTLLSPLSQSFESNGRTLRCFVQRIFNCRNELFTVLPKFHCAKNGWIFWTMATAEETSLLRWPAVEALQDWRRLAKQILRSMRWESYLILQSRVVVRWSNIKEILDLSKPGRQIKSKVRTDILRHEKAKIIRGLGGC